ncbi:dihydroneopterin aldolase [Sulfurovum sp. ST-21]|uniref:Dihydroneopterin aldolase n=1 Tax=Sulfurovum indicum TaxID=2779528 RepID=A0A7M1S5E6_9BACT|nr:dihydroneopterin aldolase [Sulfurovum indicum]QOR62302.1 dihydroneopterin aldolase [Sulfurovum indicum]
MTIHIEALAFDAIIGLLDFEQERPQRVVVDLKAGYDYIPGEFIDYADLATLIMEKVKQAHYKLLEDALLELETLILSTYPQITSLYLKISKPDILNNGTVALSHQWNY